MTKLMLIDANHAEETRVAVVKNGQIEDFDFEARGKRQLRGNIYLAKVTRVEPSLQAAFVDYGGNRHGFLAFAEIHPDYYQIPKEDREALLAEAAAAEYDDSHDHEKIEPEGMAVIESEPHADADSDTSGEHEADAAADHDDHAHPADEHAAPVAAAPAGEEEEEEEDDAEVEAAARRRAAVFQRKYRIQEVIRRRQVLLVQVVKEERGNKGAALTTYLSLAGRYCVLMPNTSRSGGVSRKITNASDRKRLKSIVSELEVPRGAGLIVRTAGAKRTKVEIVRDFEYLIKLWKQIVERTIESIAPSLIHEEGHLVLRAVRDLYDKDVEQIVVDGDQAYNEVRTFVEMLMPTHARKVSHHSEGPPLFVQTGVEDQLESIFSPTVQLPSGGYIVINQTEALVAVDVNSGRSTRERNVESTALRTNLEAAAEICRQMRLRDLAGLIVIDFIDMEETKNVRAVERKMADSLKIDRARVQTGRISQFGLFEISRQRRRAGVLELTSEVCPHCSGTGRVRSVESAAVQILRMIEARAADERVDNVYVQAPSDVALYILNEKRATIAEIERRNEITVRIEANATMKSGDATVDARDEDGDIAPYKPSTSINLGRLRIAPPPPGEDGVEEEEEVFEDSDEQEAQRSASDEDEDDEDSDGRKRRGRRGGRRRRGGREGRDGETRPAAQAPADSEHAPSAQADAGDRDRERDDGRRGRRRRRGRERDNRARTPDIAADGGEMLDAIASAPFLFATETPTDSDPDAEHNGVSTEGGGDGEPAGLPESFADAAPPPKPERGKGARAAPAPAPVDHETAATASEPDVVQDPDAGSAEAALSQAEELRRHSIHGGADPVAPPPAAEKPRRFGWWNRKQAG
jgi:ribonuclease E